MGDLPEIRETKRRLEGREETFICRALKITPWRAIIQFVSPTESYRAGFAIPAGAVTYGFFWRSRSYNLYRILAPHGELIAHRFDVITDVRLRPQRRQVEYLDLLLDVWVAPDGTATVEDEDEVEDHVARGLLTPYQQRVIARVRRHLLARNAAIIRRAATELSAIM